MLLWKDRATLMPCVRSGSEKGERYLYGLLRLIMSAPSPGACKLRSSRCEALECQASTRAPTCISASCSRLTHSTLLLAITAAGLSLKSFKCQARCSRNFHIEDAAISVSGVVSMHLASVTVRTQQLATMPVAFTKRGWRIFDCKRRDRSRAPQTSSAPELED